MKPTLERLLTLSLVLAFAAGCNSKVNLTSSATASPFPITTYAPALATTRSPTETPSPTSKPTHTPTSTYTPSPSPSPSLTPAESKPIKVLLEGEGGDGGDRRDYYFGRGMPLLVLYADGQIIVTRDSEIYEKRMSPAQTDSFLSHIRNTGFFDVEGNGEHAEFDPIYDLPEDAEISWGNGGFYISVNDGTRSKSVSIYGPYKDYLIPEVSRTYHIISTYFPIGLMPYVPRQMVLWVESGSGESYPSFTPASVTEWPDDLPSIQSLGTGHVVVSEELIPRILALFDDLPGGRLFVEHGQEYLIVARPLLPNESPSPNGEE